MTDYSFRSSELVLAGGISPSLFAWLNSVFNQVRTLDAVVGGESSLSQDWNDNLRDLKERLTVANRLLRDYLVKVLKVDLGEISLPPGYGAEAIEKGLRKQLFGD